MGNDGTPGTTLEAGAESGRREASAEETAYAGSLATSESVEKVMEAKSGADSEPLAIQGVLGELRHRLHRAETA